MAPTHESFPPVSNRWPDVESARLDLERVAEVLCPPELDELPEDHPFVIRGLAQVVSAFADAAGCELLRDPRRLARAAQVVVEDGLGKKLRNQPAPVPVSHREQVLLLSVMALVVDRIEPNTALGPFVRLAWTKGRPWSKSDVATRLTERLISASFEELLVVELGGVALNPTAWIERTVQEELDRVGADDDQTRGVDLEVIDIVTRSLAARWRRRSRDQDRTKALCDEGVAKALEAAKRDRDLERPRGMLIRWLQRIAWNASCNEARCRGWIDDRAESLDGLLAGPDEDDDSADRHAIADSRQDIEVAVEQQLLADEVGKALEEVLSPRDAAVVRLTYWEGRTGDEVAAIVGISRANVQQILHRSRNRLGPALQHLLEPPEEPDGPAAA